MLYEITGIHSSLLGLVAAAAVVVVMAVTVVVE
jgi:hypothetical protein